MIVRFRNVPGCNGSTQLINLEKATNIATTKGPTPNHYRVHINFGSERILIRDKMSLQECNNFMNTLQMFWMEGINQAGNIPELNCAPNSITPLVQEEEEWMEQPWLHNNGNEE
jgi:hypothetical protein